MPGCTLGGYIWCLPDDAACEARIEAINAPRLLTPEQVARYDVLRGYGSSGAANEHQHQQQQQHRGHKH